MDKVKHWPSWANWYVRWENGDLYFYAELPGETPVKPWYYITRQENEFLEMVRIDPDTPWDQSLQRRPE